MIINRYLALNPLEPAPLSLRVARELPLTVNIVLAAAVTGTPITYDPKTELVLTGRSDGKQQVYPATSTNISNGMIAATIPEGALKDKNGYQVQLFGEVQATPGSPSETLIAMGVMRLIEGGL